MADSRPTWPRESPVFYVSVLEGDRRIEIDLALVKSRGTVDPEDKIRVLSFEYTDSERKADSLKLTVDNYNLRNFDDPVWKTGNFLHVTWGYPGRMAPTRKLVINKVTGFQTLTIEARALSLLMNRETKNRIFTNMTRSQVVQQVARENGWTAVDIEDTEVVFPSISQARLTDAQFVQRLARAEGYLFFVDFDGFHYHRRRTGNRPNRVYRWFSDRFGEIINITIDNDLTAKPGGVAVRGRDSTNGQDVAEKAETSHGMNMISELWNPINLTTMMVYDSPKYASEVEYSSHIVDQTGEGAAAQPQSVDPSTTVNTTDLTTFQPPVSSQQLPCQAQTRPTSTPSSAAARRQARGAQQRAQDVAIKMKLEAVGDPQQYAKTIFQLEGVGRRLGVKYYVREVVHKIDSSGYTMTLDCVSDGSGGHSTVSRAAPGLELLDPGPVRRTANTQQPAQATGPCMENDMVGSLEQIEQASGERGDWIGRVVWDAGKESQMTPNIPNGAAMPPPQPGITEDIPGTEATSGTEAPIPGTEE